MLCAFFKDTLDQSDAKILRLVPVHTPREFLVGSSRQEHAVALEKAHVDHSNRITCTSDTHGLKHSTVTELLCRSLARQEQRLGGIVWLDTTNVMRIGLLYTLNQGDELFLELLSNRLLLGLLARCGRGCGAARVFASLNRKRFLEQLARRRLKQVLGRQGNLVLVLFHKVRFDSVVDKAGKMPNRKDRLGLLHIGSVKASVLGHGLLSRNVLLIHALGKVAIASLGKTALIVKHGEDTRLGRLDRI